MCAASVAHIRQNHSLSNIIIMKIYLQATVIFLILTLVHYNTIAQEEIIDSVSFETPTSKILIDTAGSNLWQIGKPGKTFFDTAHSGINAILTDTLHDYPPNNTSSFIYVIQDPYTQTCLTCLSFWHKYDMDTLTDQGIIDASYDGGNSWVLVKDTFVNSANFMWNPDYHAFNENTTTHPLITSGKSDGWIKSGFCWQWYLPVSPDTIIFNPDSLMIRFTFISDSINTNKEGWMIDDIMTSAGGWEDCSSVKEIYLDENITVYPNPFSTEAIIQADHDFKNATMKVYNSLGQLVQQLKNISGQTINLNRDDLPSGLYFLQLTEDYKILKTIKIVITDN
jgi:hypothetical protein